MITWSEEHLRAAVTDAATLKRGLELAVATKWNNLGHSPHALWGDCQGSGSKPYQVAIDLNGPAFKCSCPSRTFPCKHGAGLMAMAVRSAPAFTAGTEPTWVEAWVAKRGAKESAPTAPAAPKATADPEAQAKREAKRGERMRDGLLELERWLLDAIRAGLATVQGWPVEQWERQAARLVDAQMPGLASRLRELAFGHQDLTALRDALGELYLLVRTALRNDALAPQWQEEVAHQLGVNTKREVVLATRPAVIDRWWVLGQVITEEERLTQRRVWFFGMDSGRYALMIDHAFGSQGFPSVFIPNGVYEGAMHFFPGLHPLRATAQELHLRPELAPGQSPERTPSAALDAQARAVADAPWARQWPMWLDAVVPEVHKDEWMLRHAEGLLPLDCSEVDGWSLAAQSGGHALSLFGEWNGRALRPIRATRVPTS